MLKEGEVLPSVEIDEEVEATQQERDMNMGLIPGGDTPQREERNAIEAADDVDRQAERDALRD